LGDNALLDYVQIICTLLHSHNHASIFVSQFLQAKCSSQCPTDVRTVKTVLNYDHWQINIIKFLKAQRAVVNVVSFVDCMRPGGEDFDQRVMDHFIKLYKKKKGQDIRGNNRAVQKLRREVEKAKRALSSQHQARIEIESFAEGEDFSETLTRAKFEELNMVRITELK